MANNQYVNKVIFGNDTILDISEDTVVSSALLSGYTAHAGSGASISGNILTKTSSDLTASGLTVTVPSGYYGTAATKTLTDNNLIAANIKDGVTIFGVTGTLVGGTILISDTIDTNGGTIRTITTTDDPIYLETLNVTSNGTYIPTSGHYYSSVSVEVEGSGVAAILQEKTNITPTESSQTIEPDSGYNGLSSVQINAIPSTYVGSSIISRSSSDLTVSGATVNVPAGYYNTAASKTLSDANLIASNIKNGVSIFGITGSYTGNAPNISSLTITPSASQQVIDKYELIASDNIYKSFEYPYPSKNASINLTSGTTYKVIYDIAYTDGGGSYELSNNEEIFTYNGTSVIYTHNYIQLIIGGATTYVDRSGSVTIDYISCSFSLYEQVADGYAPITIEGDSNLVATNIKSGVTIFGVTGSYEGSGGGSATLQAKTNIDPTTSSQTIEPDDGYDGLSSVQINAMPSMTLPTSATSSATSGYTSKATISRSTSDQYINIPTGYNAAGAYYKINAVANGTATAPASISGTSATISTGTNTITLTKTISVTPSVTAGYISSGTAGNSSVSLTASMNIRSSSDLTASGATVTVPTGYYSSEASKSVTTMTLPTSASASATSGYTSKATISRSTSAQYINIPPGYNSAGGYYTISAVANGSATGPSSLSGTSATVSTGTNTITLTKMGVTTTPTVSAGYVSAATASTATVTLTASVTTKAAATITPGTSDQTIASGTYLTGTQTISGDADLTAANIKVGVGIFGVTGTYTSDATADASEILNTKTAYVNGSKLTGSLVIATVYVGSAAPSASTGINGDIYIQS